METAFAMVLFGTLPELCVTAMLRVPPLRPEVPFEARDDDPAFFSTTGSESLCELRGVPTGSYVSVLSFLLCCGTDCVSRWVRAGPRSMRGTDSNGLGSCGAAEGNAEWEFNGMGPNMSPNGSGHGTCWVGVAGQLPRPIHVGVVCANMAEGGFGILCPAGVAGYPPVAVDVGVLVEGSMGPNMSPSNVSRGGVGATATSLGGPCATCPTSACGTRATADNEDCAGFDALGESTTSSLVYRGMRGIGAPG